VLVEKKFQLGNNRSSALALRALWFVHVAPPDGVFDPNFGTIVVLPSESPDLFLSRAGESRRGDHRRGRFGKNGRHLGFFLERVRVGFSGWPRFRNLDIMHRVRVLQHALATRVTKRAAQKVFDVAQRRAAKVLPASDILHQLLGFESPHVAQRHVAIRLQIPQPNVLVSAIRGSALLLLHIGQLAVLDELIEAHRTFWSMFAAID
jgi:hypothetical protein